MYKASSFVTYIDSQGIRKITPAKDCRYGKITGRIVFFLFSVIFGTICWVLSHISHAKNYQWCSSQNTQYVMTNIWQALSDVTISFTSCHDNSFPFIRNMSNGTSTEISADAAPIFEL